jgi:hypothetical protein
MTALARQLQARGHDVVFLYSSGAAGLPFVPAPEKDHISQTRREMSKMQGEDALCLWLASSELSRIATRHSRRK